MTKKVAKRRLQAPKRIHGIKDKTVPIYASYMCQGVVFWVAWASQDEIRYYGRAPLAEGVAESHEAAQIAAHERVPGAVRTTGFLAETFRQQRRWSEIRAAEFATEANELLAHAGMRVAKEG